MASRPTVDEAQVQAEVSVSAGFNSFGGRNGQRCASSGVFKIVGWRVRHPPDQCPFAVLRLQVDYLIFNQPGWRSSHAGPVESGHVVQDYDVFVGALLHGSG
jgi:hypothetical protein